MLSRFSQVILLLIVLVFISTQKTTAQYIQSDAVLTAGQTVTVAVPGADSLIITYRPGSNIAETQIVSVEGASYEWTPREAGIVSLATPGGPTQTVSVSFSSFPVPGFIVLIIAGGILFGGATYASVNLFGKTSAKAITDRPDT